MRVYVYACVVRSVCGKMNKATTQQIESDDCKSVEGQLTVQNAQKQNMSKKLMLIMMLHCVLPSNVSAALCVVGIVVLCTFAFL